jgi:two-component system sensor histidine kinase LytS
VARRQSLYSMIQRRRFTVELFTGLAVAGIAAVAVATLMFDLPATLLVGIVIVLAGVAISGLAANHVTRPDHIQAQLSHQVLEIANESLTHFRKGLDPLTAAAVCRLALRETGAAAVAITDRERVLAFAGVGEDHHIAGGPIITRATEDAISTNEHRILSTREEIGCPDPYCALRAAVVVPLEIRDEAIGTLKFYYTEPRLLTETQVTMAEGLAQLLSTQLEVSELEQQRRLASDMELKALQAQINPHFLFNTINTVAMFIRTDPAEARRLLREFAAFYRRMLENNAEIIPLERELEYTGSYITLEQARFGVRLEVSVDVEPSALAVLVPSFIVQPIVENSVKHGIRPTGALHVDIAGRMSDSTLTLEVRDDGVGIPPERLPHVLEPGFGTGLGIALKNVDDRLKGHFGPESGLVIESEAGVGTTVRLLIRLGTRMGQGESDDAQSAGM